FDVITINELATSEIYTLSLHDALPISAQIGACRVGEMRLQELVEKLGAHKVERLCSELLDYSERLMQAELSQMPAGTFSAEDFLDRKSTRLNSSHRTISYAVFCLKKKK